MQVHAKERRETTRTATKRRPRHIPAALRDEVLERASHRCEYQGRGGRRCQAQTALHIDHRKPYARGGRHSPENLRVLCREHNLYVAERQFGVEWVREKVAAKKNSTRRP